MLGVLHDDQVLITEALACLDVELRAGQLDPDRRELQVLALPSGARLLVGWNGACAVAALRRAEPELPRADGLAEGEGAIAVFQSVQSGRRNLAALMIRLLALQVGARTMTE